MPTTTTNFGWTVPSDTDLVKDGAAAIRTALGGVDTSLVDLKGGTTGQTLTKATGTDLDFSWTTPTSSVTFAGCRLTRSASVAIANATETTLNWDTETFDTNTYHSTSTNTNRITIPSGKAGYYQIEFVMNWTDADATGRRLTVFRVNGTAEIGVESTPSSSATLSYYGATTKYMAVGDYVDLYVLQTSGSNKNVGTGSYFGITYLGA